MPLSEHEQRLLEQIEQAFYAEDPKFANAYRTTDLRTLVRRRLIRLAVLLLAGIGLVVAGVITTIMPMTAAGGFVTLAAVALAVSTWLRFRRPREPRPARPAVVEHTSWRQRLEERWERRWDDRGR